MRKVAESYVGHGVVGKKRSGLGDKGWEGKRVNRGVFIRAFESLIISF